MIRLVRVLSLCSTLAALAIWEASALAAPTRPAGAPTGEVIAEVHLRIGTGSVLRTGGRDYPATPGTALLRDDQLVVPAGQVLVVSLRNDYLVRLDDDVSLRVGQIVLVDAPRSTESFVKQLDRILTRDEQRRAERIAGVQARMSGADPGGDIAVREKSRPSPVGNDPSPQPQPKPQGKATAAEVTTGGAAHGDGTRRDDPRSKHTPARDNGGPPLQVPAADPKPSQKLEKRPDTPSAPPPPVNARPPSTAGPAESTKPSSAGKGAERDRDERVQPSLPHEPELLSCLTKELRALPVKLAKVQLRIHGSGGKIDRLGLGGGLIVPPCARKLLIGSAWTEAEGRWVDRELALQ